MNVVEREKLLNALEYIQPGLSARAADLLEQANCFAIKDGYIWSYNDEVACRVKSPIPDVECAIQSAPVLAALHKMKQKELSVRLKKSRLYFEAKRDRVGLTVEKEIALPLEDLDYPKKSQWKPLPTNFDKAIRFVEGCASRDDSNRALTCIHLHPKMVETFDNYQFARYDMKLPLDQEVLVKQIALKHISQMTMIEFFETENWVHFRDARKRIFSCRVYLAEWPSDLCDDIAMSKGKKVKLPQGLISASEIAEILATDSANPNENYIELTLDKNWVYIVGEGQFGKYDGKRPLKGYKGDKFTFLVLPKVLAQLVKNQPKCRLSEQTLKAKTGKATFVTSLTPPRKKQQDKEVEKSKKKKKKGKKNGR